MDNPQRAHFNDPECLEFDALITAQALPAGGLKALVLDQTYFYPTGGGQAYDTGTLQVGDVIVQVKDVLKAEDAGVITLAAGGPLPPQAVLHVVDQFLPLGAVAHARIDAHRRLRHRQHHTAQHLLTYCFVHLFGFETLSANINGHTPSTLDLSTGEVSEAQARQAEDLANAEIYANRPVHANFVTYENARLLPLRKPPTVTENIRVVDIDQRDFSACGGTHVSQTGAIGLIKIVRLEKIKGKTRIHFVAGEQALEVFQHTFAGLARLANSLSAHPDEVPNLVERQSEQIKALLAERSALRQELLPIEADRLLAAASIKDGVRMVKARFDDRTAADLRLFAQAMRDRAATGGFGLIAYLAAYDGNKFSLVVSSHASGIHAAESLRQALSVIEGKGGGDGSLAQGGGAATPDQAKRLWEALP